MTDDGTIKISRLALNEVIEALGQCAEYLEPMIDADGDPNGGWIPNKEMSLYALCEHTLDMLPPVFKAPALKPRPHPLSVMPYPDGINEVLALKR